MKKSLFHLIIFTMILCLFPQLLLAQTGYVSDMLLLTFREGPGNSYEITKTLKSDTPVSILGEENGFYKVELQSMEIGWVDMKFIIFEPPKTLIIEELNRENKSLEDEILKLKSTVQTFKNKTFSQEGMASQEIKSLEASLKTAVDERDAMENLLSDSREEYTTLINQSKNIEKIIKENKILHKKNVTLSKDLGILKKETKNVFKTGMIKWFLAGVGVLLLGWIIGQNVFSKKQRAGSLLD